MSAPVGSIAALEAFYKTRYPPEKIKDMTYPKNPFYAMVSKDEKFGGDGSKEPIIYENMQNRSADFATANTQNTDVESEAFFITRVANYSTAKIQNQAMEAAIGDMNAFEETATVQMDSAIRSLARSICTHMFRNGTGTVAQIAGTASLAGTTLATGVQLANPTEIANLAVGMSIAFSATDGGAVRSGTAIIVQIDRIAGKFLCSATYKGAGAALSSLVSGVAVGDYIYASAGDRNNVISGLAGWLPGNAATSALWFGVNRTPDITRLAGLNYDGSGMGIDEALIGGASITAINGGSPDTCFINYLDFQKLTNVLGAKQQYVQQTMTKVDTPFGSFGYNTLILTGPYGPIKIVPDVNCAQGTSYLLQLDTWKLKSLGPCVKIFNSDGLNWLRAPGEDALQIRCLSYSQLSCRAPGFNCKVTLPA